MSKRRANGVRSHGDNIDNFIDDDINVDDRIIHLFESISNVSSSKVIKGIQLMLAKGKDKPIDIYINSFGGCPYSSMAIYDFIRACKETTIRTYAIGCAMSGGSIVFMAGDERYMYKNSVLMLHTVASIAEGKIFDMDIETEECKRIFKQMCDLYAEGTNKSTKQWANLLKYEDRYYRPVKALELGFIDKIIEKNLV